MVVPGTAQRPMGRGSSSSETAADPYGNHEIREKKQGDSDASGGILGGESEPQVSDQSPAARHASIASTKTPTRAPDGRRIITEEECKHLLGYSWPMWKKWMLLTSIFIVQLSMNFNTSVYPNAITPLAEHFGVPEIQPRLGHSLFLILYAFGCELWAPWSEEFGRWKVLQ